MDNEEESYRYNEKIEHYLGSAKILLEDLHFEKLKAIEFLDQKNVARLRKVFELEGCLRLDPEHHIPAIIDPAILEQSLYQSSVDRAELFSTGNLPEISLPPQHPLSCLHGRHRIAAAQTFLLASDRWWTVDFYSNTLGKTLRQDIQEDYSNSRNFCDGDIYRRVRTCQTRQDSVGEGRWLARLTEAKRKDLKQLQQRDELKHLAKALDSLLPYVGFWPDLRIGTFHRVLNLKCPEELRHYLLHIKSCWDDFIDGEEGVRSLIDYGTVRRLQLRNPWASRVDYDFVTESMEQETLFPFIKDPETRSRILTRVQSIQCIIPSLYTFFEDTKWLEPCAKILRKLTPTGCKKTIKQSLLAYHSGRRKTSGRLYIQTSDNNFYTAEASDSKIADLGYRQLWLFAWRHFPALSTLLPRKDHGQAKPQAKAQNEQCWHELATVANSLGFQSDNITQLINRNPDLEMAQAFLHRVRPQEFFMVPEEHRAAAAQHICQMLTHITRPEPSEADNSDTSFESEVAVPSRCGRPFDQSYRYTKSRFFLPDIYNHTERKVTHLSVNRDIFIAFFGIDSMSESNTTTPRRKGKRAQKTNGMSPRIGNQDSADMVVPDGPNPVSSQPHGSAPQNVDATSSNQQLPSETVQSEGRSTPMVQGNELAIAQNKSTMSQIVPYDLQDLGRCPLFDCWTTDCKIGDMFLVSIPDGGFLLLKPKDLPDKVLPIADHIFAVPNPKRPAWSYVDVAAMFSYRKGTQYDGVIYHHPRRSSNGDGTKKILEDPLIGKDTKARLREIELRVERKKREKPWHEREPEGGGKKLHAA